MGKKSGGRVRVKQVGPKAPVNPLDAFTIPPEEMINFIPKPDSNICHVWPMSETFTMDYKQFSIIYPNYIDANKTVNEGRRIAAKDAILSPTVVDIGQALQTMGIRHVVQPYKGYSRDGESQWDNLGRVLVDMEQPVPEVYDADDMGDGKQSKKVLMREISKRIPLLPGRIRRLEEEQLALEVAKAKEAASHKAVAQKPTASGGASAKKKKGKKKR